MHENTQRNLLRDCEAIRIPSGEVITLSAGTSVLITQALGGSYTVATDAGLARITDANADALGLESQVSAAATVPDIAAGDVAVAPARRRRASAAWAAALSASRCCLSPVACSPRVISSASS